MKYFVKSQFGIVGCYAYDVIEAKSLEQANEEAYTICIEHAQSYGFEQDGEAFGDLDTVGAEWDEETGEYAQEGFIDPHVTEYVPEKHDMYLY